VIDAREHPLGKAISRSGLRRARTTLVPLAACRPLTRLWQRSDTGYRRMCGTGGTSAAPPVATLRDIAAAHRSDTAPWETLTAVHSGFTSSHESAPRRTLTTSRPDVTLRGSATNTANDPPLDFAWDVNNGDCSKTHQPCPDVHRGRPRRCSSSARGVPAQSGDPLGSAASRSRSQRGTEGRQRCHPGRRRARDGDRHGPAFRGARRSGNVCRLG
jgi:hypothetical protein